MMHLTMGDSLTTGINMIVMITAGIMLFSLGIRIIKLTIYQGFAPLFIAAGANQDTKRFCINFLASYILLSLQLVVMTVVYAMFRTSFAAYLASAASITTFSWKGFFTGGMESKLKRYEQILREASMQQEQQRRSELHNGGREN